MVIITCILAADLVLMHLRQLQDVIALVSHQLIARIVAGETLEAARSAHNNEVVSGALGSNTHGSAVSNSRINNVDLCVIGKINVAGCFVRRVTGNVHISTEFKLAGIVDAACDTRGRIVGDAATPHLKGPQVADTTGVARG